MPRKWGFSFSWKRALGISGAKARLSRKLGIPLTRSGLERKIGREAISGCSLYLLAGLFGFLTIVVLVMSRL